MRLVICHRIFQAHSYPEELLMPPSLSCRALQAQAFVCSKGGFTCTDACACAGPGTTGFSKEPVEAAVGALTVRWPGVRHCQLHDTEALGEHVLYLTRQLAEQPYASQASARPSGCG